MKLTLKIFKYILLSILALIVLVPVLLYLPPVQTFVCNQVVNYLNESQDEFTYSVSKIRIDFPLQLRVEGVEAVSRKDGSVVFGLGKLITGLDDVPLGKSYYLVKKLNLEDVVIGCDSLTESLGVVGDVNALSLENLKISKDFDQILLDKVVLSDPNLIVALGPSKDTIDEPDSSSYYVNVNQILMTDGNLQFDMSDKSLTDALTSVNLTNYFDYNHLLLDSLSLDIEDLIYDDDLISCKILSMTAHEENCDLAINKLKADFCKDGNFIKVTDTDLRMPESHINGDLSLDLDFFNDSIHSGFITTDIEGSINSHDLIAFAAPYVNTFDGAWPEERTNFTLDTRVTKDTLDLHELTLKVDNHADLKIEGFGLNPLDNDSRVLNVTVKGDVEDGDFLLSTFVDKPSKRMYKLPEGLFLEIDASQNKTHMSGDFLIKQDREIVAEGNGYYDTKTESYKINAKADNFHLGEFVPSTGIDRVSAHVDAEGRHLAFPGKYTRLELKAQLDTLLFSNTEGNRDSIVDINIDASLLNTKYFTQIESQHPYLRLDTQLDGIFDKKNISAQGYIDLENLDLKHMPKIVSYDLGKLALESDIDFSYDYGDNAFADLYIHTMSYDDGSNITPFDNIDLNAKSEPGLFKASLSSGDAELNIKTDRSIAEIYGAVDSLLAEVNRQIEMTHLDLSAIQKKIPQANAELKIARENPFYPVLNLMGYRFKSIDANITNNEVLNASANIYGLNMESTRLDTIQFALSPRENINDYNYNIHANCIAPKVDESYDVKMQGKIMSDSLTTCVKYLNGRYITMYDADVSLALAYDSLCLRFLEGPIIYAQQCKINDDNYFIVTNFKNVESQALDAHAKLKFEGPQDMKISIFTRHLKDANIGNEMLLRLKNIDLNYIAKTLQWDGNVGGILDGDFTAQFLPQNISGNLQTKVRNFNIGEYRADTLVFDGIASRDFSKTSFGGKLTVDNYITLNTLGSIGDSVNIDLGLDKLPLPLLNAFMPNDVQFAGTTTGTLNVQGKDFNSSKINAFLTMNKANVNYADCDATIHFPNDTIRMRDNVLGIRSYNMTFANDNPLTVSGIVDLRESLINPELRLKLEGENVKVFDNKKPKNKIQYICGTLPASADLRINGKVSDMKITGNVKALSGTNLIYYLEDDPLKSESKVNDLVEFVSFREMDRVVPEPGERPMMISGEKEEGMSVNINIDIANNAKVLAHLQEGTDDRVSLIGGGSLQLNCQSDGSLIMSGMYDITDGDFYYKLPMLPVSKEFKLSDKSWISWNGAVDDPNINLIAIEDVRSSVNDGSGSRVVNFEVSVNISGTLDGMDVTFTCDAPEDASISQEIASLTDEEKSKQALLLLIAQTYSGPGVSSSMGLASANAAINSILNKEVESLLSNKFKNTDINLGIDTYDADGVSRTDYSVKVSQRLFNDKMRVTVGGKMSSGESEDMGQQDAMINDVSLEWLFKDDGSNYLKLFRKTNYENILEGEVVETGVGYVQQRSAYKFKHLLINQSKKRQALMEAKIKEMREAEEKESREERRRKIQFTNDTIQSKDSIGFTSVISADSLQYNK